MFLIRLHAGVGHPVSFPALVLSGLLIGVVSGMFGVGGGFLLTPLLMYGFGVPAPMAVGSALCQQSGTAIASFLKYRHLGRGDRSTGRGHGHGGARGASTGRWRCRLARSGDASLARPARP